MRLVPIGIGESFGEAKLVRATHAWLLWRHDHVDPRAVADYITGFSKIIENGFRKTLRAVESGQVEKLNPVEIHVEGLLRELNPDDNARAGLSIAEPANRVHKAARKRSYRSKKDRYSIISSACGPHKPSSLLNNPLATEGA